MQGAVPTDPPRDLGVYVHWPYCEAICPYCDFNVRLARNVDHAVWRRAFRADIAAWKGQLPNRQIASVFFGGGTPSLMAPGTVSAVLDALADVWTIDEDVEVSMEANPTSVESARFQDFVSAGINRMSVGIQSLDDQALLQLGRRHNAAEARHALQVARDVCDRVSFDLIYGRPHQTCSAWEAELSDALQICGEHCSLYQLTIEPGTPFHHQAQRGRLHGLPNEEDSAQFYDLTNAICAVHGLDRYEVSNHARAGGQSRHNRLYWTAQDWIGLGPGAHGRLTLDGRRVALAEDRDPTQWMAQAGQEPMSKAGVETLTAEEAAEEVIFGGLRLREGFKEKELRRWGHTLPTAKRTQLIADELLIEEEGMIRVTDHGALLVDAIVEDLVPLQALR